MYGRYRSNGHFQAYVAAAEKNNAELVRRVWTNIAELVRCVWIDLKEHGEET